MNLTNLTFSQEPAVYIAVGTALLNLAIGFGLPITPDQKILIGTLLTAAAGVLIRSQVKPV